MLQAVVDLPVVGRGHKVVNNTFFKKIQKHKQISPELGAKPPGQISPDGGHFLCARMVCFHECSRVNAACAGTASRFLPGCCPGYFVPLMLNAPNPLRTTDGSIKKSRYSPGEHGLF
jgi:hypothetical protein